MIKVHTPISSPHDLQRLQCLQPHDTRARERLPLIAPPQQPHKRTNTSDDKADVIHRLDSHGSEDWEAENDGEQRDPQHGEAVAEGSEDTTKIEVAGGERIFAAAEESHTLGECVSGIEEEDGGGDEAVECRC